MRHRSTLSWIVPVLLGLSLCGCSGCSSDPVPGTSGGGDAKGNTPLVPRSAEDIRAHNRGVALMGQLRQTQLGEAEEIFAELAQRHPTWLDVQVDQAIAKFNQQEADGPRTSAYIVDSLEIFQRVLRADPDHTRAHYSSGILQLYQGRPDAALVHFEKVARDDPQDAYAAYLVGRCLFDTRRREESLTWFQRAIDNDPYLYSAYYNASVTLRLLGRPDEADAMTQTAQRLFHNPLSRTYKEVYSRFGPKGEVVALTLDEPPKIGPPDGPLFSPPMPLNIENAAELTWRRLNADDPHQPSLTACDIDGDGHIDLFIAGALLVDGQAANAVLISTETGWRADLAHPLTGVSDVQAALWGDFDNDTRTDVYLCRAGENQLWRQAGLNSWQDVTAETQTGGGPRSTVDGAVFDADHDGDLDYFLINADGPNELLSNNLDGTFRPLGVSQGIAGDGRPSRQVVTTDLDNDRDVDLLIINEQPPHEVYLNDRLWQYHASPGVEEFIATPIDAAVAMDIDRDGETELITLSPAGLTRWKRDEQLVWKSASLRESLAADLPYTGRGRLASADVEGDGTLDVTFSSGDRWAFLSTRDATKTQPAIDSPAPLLSWAILNANRGGDQVVGLLSGERPVIWKTGGGRHAFARLTFSGRHADEPRMRSNASGIGLRAAARLGAEWTLRDTFRNGSGPGQSLQPQAYGLAGQRQLDFISLYWSDGVFQTEGGPGTDVVLDSAGIKHIEEINREPTSCPLLFVWDGQKYAFVSDLLATGGLGYNLGRGVYGPSDPTESFLLPDELPQPRDGAYHIKLAEPLEELSYIDHVQLVAYDLPPGWQMTVDERMAGQDPQPTGQAVFFRHELSPAAVFNDRGEDVTPSLLAADRGAAEPGAPDDRFLGRTADWSLTLRFASPLDAPPADADGAQLTLVADGWIDFPYSQTMFAAWQAGAEYRVPSMEARAPGGTWQTVNAAFGYPGGMPRQISVPLSALPSGATQLRISTNHEIYWDRLRLVWAEPCPLAIRRPLELTAARLRHVGFPQRTTGAQRLHAIDYSRRRMLADVRHPSGLYTAFGPVDELVSRREGALAIFGPGEELHLEFAPTLPVDAGWSRRLLLELVGWCKDMDLFTAHGETVTPLPSQQQYPSGAAARREALHRKYLTRFEAGR